jgi:1-acyl-sn-glycerol-3-phosphate acyltransferase
MNSKDTSAFWRKLLDLDRPLAPRLLSKYKSRHRILRPIVSGMLNLLLRFYCREKIVGIENIPAGSPFIIATNHSSSLDYATIAFALKKKADELYPITTKLFYDHFFTGFWIRAAANAVRIDLEADFFVALREAAKVLRAGKSVYINPEGKRSLTGEILSFHAGVGVLAVESGVPIIPVCINGTLAALPPGKILPRPKPITVTIGEPIQMQPYIEKKQTVQAYDVYKEVTEELRNRVISLCSKDTR